MHPRKAEVLGTCEETGDIAAQLVRDSLRVIVRPDLYGWDGSLTTSAILPLHAFILLMTDLNAVMIARSSDATWEQAFPSPPE